MFNVSGQIMQSKEGQTERDRERVERQREGVSVCKSMMMQKGRMVQRRKEQRQERTEME